MLLLLIIIPLIGAGMAAFAHGKAIKHWALAVAGLTFLVNLIAAFSFDFNAGAGPQFKQSLGSIDAIGLHLSVGMDSISLWLSLLTTLLTPLALAASFESIKDREHEYYAWMLVLLAAMVGVFIAQDVLLFYVFFELTLVPMFFIIGIWGGPERRYAAGKFFLFTFTGSVFTLAAAVYLGVKYGTFNIAQITDLAQHGGQLNGVVYSALSTSERYWIFLGMFAGFAVKVPLFPVHTWLPLAHTEAPTAGSVILAGVLLKLGTYGLLRLAVPIALIDGNWHEVIHQGAWVTITLASLVHFVGVLCLIGIIYGALAAWVQQDIKKLVAYSSVSHLGFCVLGLLALNNYGIQGSILYMINHGLSTGAMFLCVGMVYDRYHTRDIEQLSGLARRMPILAFFWILFTLSSIGLPGLNGFVSEFLSTLGAFNSPFLGKRFGAVAALGIILGAIYMLHMAAKVIWGPLKAPDVHDDHGSAPAADSHGHASHGAPGDLSPREIGILVPLAILVIVLGLFPAGLMQTMHEPIEALRHDVIEQTRVPGEGPIAQTQAQTPPALAVAR
jgi:NADH-quinone oxidoreductase subunit M